jgi:hypothetical protein
MLHSGTPSSDVLAYNMLGVTVVLANPCALRGLMVNPDFRKQHGDSCACRGMVSRGVLTGVHAWSSSVCQSRVHPCLFESLAARESSGDTGIAVAMSCQHRVPQHHGWLYDTEDGRTVLGMAA